MLHFSPTWTVRYYNLIESVTCHVAGRLWWNKLVYFWIPLKIFKKYWFVGEFTKEQFNSDIKYFNLHFHYKPYCCQRRYAAHKIFHLLWRSFYITYFSFPQDTDTACLCLVAAYQQNHSTTISYPPLLLS